jgi:signal transduction histidine kinase
VIDTAEHRSVEPLFASRAQLWLRVWIATQAAAIVVSAYVALSTRRPGGAAGATEPRDVVAVGIAVAVLAAYHAAGVLAYSWLLRRTWAVALYVPLGWVLIVAALRVTGAFALLIFGAVIQGFIFLPFAWAIATLALVTLAIVATFLRQAGGLSTSLAVARLGAVLATSVMVGTVMLYIHRANRDAAIRSRLLRQLDEAQRDLAGRARQAGVQEERQRLARDIHDTLAQGFTSVIKHLEAIELSFDAARANESAVVRGALPHLMHAQTVSRESLAEIRRLVWALRPAPLAESSLAAAIERIVAQWSEANGVEASCTIDALPVFQPDAEVIFLRATQESLSNVARHANATHVTVTLSCVDGLALLSVEDDGRGFADAADSAVDSDTPHAGKTGIAGMRARVRPFGGHVLLESEPGRGTSITVAIPLDAIVMAAT